MKCPKCQRQMDEYPQLKRYRCEYCDHTVDKAKPPPEKPSSGWISCDYRLPEEGTVCLIGTTESEHGKKYSPVRGEMIKTRKGRMSWFFIDDNYTGWTPTHWQPIPPPPET